MQTQVVSIKRNFVYKSLLTISNYLMAFITFPYISRILGVENVGLVNFVDNTINYFLLFATMGISVLGVREIAAVGDNRKERNKVFSNILGVNLLFTLLTSLIYILVISSVNRFNQYSELFYIGISKILFTAFLIEWFFTGIENFRYITIRSLAVKSLYVLSVFIFVKNPNDYKLYFLLTLSVTIINALINIIYSRAFVDINLRELFNFRYLKGNITLGIYSIMTSMYLTFNVMFLGLMTDNIQVGYYTTAFKLYSVILGLFSAFTSVMLPRMSSLLANNENDKFSLMVNKSFSLVSMFSVPLILCSIVLAPQIVYVLSGPGYEGAVLPMQIIMPAVFFVGIAQILAVQILMPMKKDKVLLITSTVGAVVSIMINFLLVRVLQSVGAAIVLLCSELVVTTIYTIYITRTIGFRIRFTEILKELILSIPSVLICIVVSIYINNQYLSLAVSFVSSVSIWLILRYLIDRKLFEVYFRKLK